LASAYGINTKLNEMGTLVNGGERDGKTGHDLMTAGRGEGYPEQGLRVLPGGS